MTLETLHGLFTLADARILSQVKRPFNSETRPLDCAQIAPKICQKYQNESNNIEIHRNPGSHKNRPNAEELLYFLRLSFWRGLLHTVGVTGLMEDF